MPDDFVIMPYLEAIREEVKSMLLTEYNEGKTMELFKEEGRAEGLAEGRAEGREEGMDAKNISNLKTIMRKMKLSAQKAMDFLDISPEDQERYAPLLKEVSEQYSSEEK